MPDERVHALQAAAIPPAANPHYEATIVKGRMAQGGNRHDVVNKKRCTRLSWGRSSLAWSFLFFFSQPPRIEGITSLQGDLLYLGGVLVVSLFCAALPKRFGELQHHLWLAWAGCGLIVAGTSTLAVLNVAGERFSLAAPMRLRRSSSALAREVFGSRGARRWQSGVSKAPRPPCSMDAVWRPLSSSRPS